LTFVRAGELKKDCDVVFLATPHGASMDMVKNFIETGMKIIDLSADFRLHNPEDYKTWYGYEHKYPEILPRAIYGLPELHREQMKNAKLIACPGCLATSAILALAPLAASKLIDTQHVVVDSKIGSSASGHSFDASTHHPDRAGVVRAYKPTGHRHTAEMEQELGALINAQVRISFSPHAVELVRGIMTTAHAFLADDQFAASRERSIFRESEKLENRKLEDIDLWKTYRAFYKGSPFVRLVKEKSGVYRYPEPKLVAGTNFCDIGFEIDSHAPRVVAMSAIDNLVKGAGGQGTQCMNIMFGLEEKTGLWRPGLHPV